MVAQVLTGPGETDPAIRQAAANNAGIPEDLRPLIAKVHAHAYKVTDADLARLQSTYGDDKLFEIIVSAAASSERTLTPRSRRQRSATTMYGPFSR